MCNTAGLWAASLHGALESFPTRSGSTNPMAGTAAEATFPRKPELRRGGSAESL